MKKKAYLLSTTELSPLSQDEYILEVNNQYFLLYQVYRRMFIMKPCI